MKLYTSKKLDKLMENYSYLMNYIDLANISEFNSEESKHIVKAIDAGRKAYKNKQKIYFTSVHYVQYYFIGTEKTILNKVKKLIESV